MSTTIWNSIIEHKDPNLTEAQRESIREELSFELSKMFSAYASPGSGFIHVWLDRLQIHNFHVARYALQIAYKFYPHRCPNLGEVEHIIHLRQTYGEMACTATGLTWTQTFSSPDQEWPDEPFVIVLERLARAIAGANQEEKKTA